MSIIKRWCVNVNIRLLNVDCIPFSVTWTTNAKIFFFLLIGLIVFSKVEFVFHSVHCIMVSFLVFNLEFQSISMKLKKHFINIYDRNEIEPRRMWCFGEMVKIKYNNVRGRFVWFSPPERIKISLLKRMYAS